MEFEFERRRITKEDVRELIYREILEYHPKMLKEYLEGSEPTGFMYPRYSHPKFDIVSFSLSCMTWYPYIAVASTFSHVDILCSI